MRAQPPLLLAVLTFHLLHGALSQEHAPSRVIVLLDNNKVFPMSEKDMGIQLTGTVGTQGAFLYKITDNSTVERKVEQLKSMAGVLAAEPDYKVYVNSTIPNDPKFQDQWHLAKVSAPAAWDISTGMQEVKVCVVDSGVRVDHPDLASQVAAGFNLVPADETNPNNPPPAATDPQYKNFNDTLGHGTHVAGTIAALTNNNLGVAGTAWNVRLVVCRFIWNDGSGYISDAMNCLKLCQGEGALISSNSWGGIAKSDFLATELQAANQAGQLFVVAAGNNGQDMDATPLYPASFVDIPNVLSVASTDVNDVISGFSNYGKNTIHISAPGEAILSTTYDGAYGQMWGTSMATPIVTAAAALVQSVAMAAGRTLTHTEVKEYVLKGVDATADGANKVITGGRLNIYKALQAVRADFPLALSPSPPPPSPSPPPPSPPPPSPPPPVASPPPPSPPPPSPPPPVASPPPPSPPFPSPLPPVLSPPPPSPPPPSPPTPVASPPPPSPSPPPPPSPLLPSPLASPPPPSPVASPPPPSPDVSITLNPKTIQCGTSVAKGRPAFQSSTATGRPASLAVDGSCNTNPAAAPFCAQTDPNDRDPYWYLDLGKELVVRSVMITTRADVSWEALGSAQVLLGNQSWVDGGSVGSFSLCGSVESAFGPNTRQPVYCNQGRGQLARYVVIYRPASQTQLTLCEVDVVADTPADTSLNYNPQQQQQQQQQQRGSRKLQRWLHMA